MAKKKPKQIGNAPGVVVSRTLPEKKPLGWKSIVFTPTFLSTASFGLSGFLAGLANGLNNFPTLGETNTVPKMMMLAAYLGDPHFDSASGLAGGFSGLLIGACLGFSALSDVKTLLQSMMISVFLGTLAILFTGNFFGVGLGFLVGHAPAIYQLWKKRGE